LQIFRFATRDPQRLVSLQSGVTEHKENFSVAGRRVENKTALLDGVDNRDPATGLFTASLSLDSLAEFNSNYTNADTNIDSSYGQNSAPLLAAITKSGANQYHGQASGSSVARVSTQTTSSPIEARCRVIK